MGKLLVLIAFISLFFCGCASTKKIVENHEKTQIENITIERDSISIERISEPIKDTVFISLKTNDIKIDSIVNERLKGLNTSRSSGLNKITVVYDTIYKAIKVTSSVQGSTDKKTEIKTKIATENSNKEVRIENRTKKTGFSWRFYLIIALIIVLTFSWWFYRFKF